MFCFRLHFCVLSRLVFCFTFKKIVDGSVTTARPGSPRRPEMEACAKWGRVLTARTISFTLHFIFGRALAPVTGMCSCVCLSWRKRRRGESSRSLLLWAVDHVASCAFFLLGNQRGNSSWTTNNAGIVLLLAWTNNISGDKKTSRNGKHSILDFVGSGLMRVEV